MIKASKVAIAIAVVAPVAIATAGKSLAAPVPPGAITAKAPAPTEVQYRTYFDYDYGPYTYRPAYRYGIFDGGNMGVRRRQLHAMLMQPTYDPLTACGGA